MEPNKLKDGVSVKELESYAKGHRFELFICLALLLACFFSFAFFTTLCLILAPVGGILGVLLAKKAEGWMRSIYRFVGKQERTIQLILGIAGAVVSVFLPLVTFFVLGVAGGKCLAKTVEETFSGEAGK